METKNLLHNSLGLARKLRLPHDWLLAEVDAGRLPCLRIGRRILFNIDAVKRVLADRAAKSIAPEVEAGR